MTTRIRPRYADPANTTAQWSFVAPAGLYRVSVTWTGAANRTSNAMFTVLDGATAVGAKGVVLVSAAL